MVQIDILLPNSRAPLFHLIVGRDHRPNSCLCRGGLNTLLTSIKSHSLINSELCVFAYAQTVYVGIQIQTQPKHVTPDSPFKPTTPVVSMSPMPTHHPQTNNRKSLPPRSPLNLVCTLTCPISGPASIGLTSQIVLLLNSLLTSSPYLGARLGPGSVFAL